ncbi:MAG: hypothetical protein QOD94_3198, partial [Alphaproteobacteria bacterium]|nr:hypothetical protein [Alphaproteobacteria bacterium]
VSLGYKYGDLHIVRFVGRTQYTPG